MTCKCRQRAFNLYSRQFIFLRFNKSSPLDLYKLSPKGFDAVKSHLNRQITDINYNCLVYPLTLPS